MSAQDEMRRGLRALYLEAPVAVVRDVTKLVDAALTEVAADTAERIAVAISDQSHQTRLSITEQRWLCEPAHCAFTVPLFNEASEAVDVVVADRLHAARIARADSISEQTEGDQ